MLYLALLSGLINLASQSVFMRVVGAANGNYYLTYYLTTLSFIVFSAAGNLLSSRFRRWLPLFEVLAGVYALIIFGGIAGGLLARLALPAWAAVLMLLPPAFALGVHIPLYAHFTRRTVGLTYGIYHLGAAAGVIVLEWLVRSALRRSCLACSSCAGCVARWAPMARPWHSRTGRPGGHGSSQRARSSLSCPPASQAICPCAGASRDMSTCLNRHACTWGSITGLCC
jgi:hypothetical protein